MRDELILEGLFHYLQKRGFPLSVRDYEDALLALKAGYGIPRENVAFRDRLLWLCHTLWARSEEELQTLTRLFKGFPFPTIEEQQQHFPPVANTPVNRVPSGQTGTPAPPESTRPDILPSSSLSGEVRFSPRTAHEGSVLPMAQVKATTDEPFLFMSPPLFPLRSLIIAWRRLRSPARTGPKIDVDIHATIRQRCEQGFVVEPVMLSARRNRSKLVLLMDVSQDMIAWNSLLHTFAESLQVSQSRLGSTSVFYFDRAPRTLLYRSPSRTRGESLSQVVSAHTDHQLLIVSEGGGLDTLDKETARDVFDDWRKFTGMVQNVWSPMVWLNPLPQKFWSPLTHRISRLPNLTMLELTDDNLIAAVDILRGLR